MPQSSYRASLLSLQPPLAWGLSYVFSLFIPLFVMGIAMGMVMAIGESSGLSVVSQFLTCFEPLAFLIPLAILTFAILDRLLRLGEPRPGLAHERPPGSWLLAAQAAAALLILGAFWVCEGGRVVAKHWRTGYLATYQWNSYTLAAGLLLAVTAEILTTFGVRGGKWAPTAIPLGVLVSLTVLRHHVESAFGPITILPDVWPSDSRTGIALAVIALGGLTSAKWEHSLRKQIDSTPVLLGAALWVVAAFWSSVIVLPIYPGMVVRPNEATQEASAFLVCATWLVAAVVRICVHAERRSRLSSKPTPSTG